MPHGPTIITSISANSGLPGKIMYNYHWFDDLLADLPCATDQPKYLAALQKLHGKSCN